MLVQTVNYSLYLQFCFVSVFLCILIGFFFHLLSKQRGDVQRIYNIFYHTNMNIEMNLKQVA